MEPLLVHRTVLPLMISTRGETRSISDNQHVSLRTWDCPDGAPLDPSQIAFMLTLKDHTTYLAELSH
jgi:hypothetical protein